MEGEIERLPYRYVDQPAMRDMELRGPVGRDYASDELERIEGSFEALMSQESEMVLRAEVRRDQSKGRLAVGMTVYGSHAELHAKAKNWVGLLGPKETSLDYEWSIGH